MSNPNDPRIPNGRVIVNVLSPKARSDWLKAHNAPKDYHLIHEIERNAVAESMRRAVALDLDYKSAVRALGDYWKDNPDMEQACLQAVFDAKKFAWVLADAIIGLEGARDLFNMAAGRLSSPVERIDALNAYAKLDELIARVRKSADERRDRSKKEGA